MVSPIVCACVFATIHVVGGSLSDSLSYYEVIDHINIFSRSRRSVDDVEEGLTREFIFHAFNRTFTCHLRPRTEIFSPGFKITVIHGDNSKETVGLQEGNFYTGNVVGVEDSEVHGYFEGEMFTGTVFIEGQLFVIEPLWRHVDDAIKLNYKGRMVVYRGSDIRLDFNQHKAGKSGTFCGSVHAEDEVDSGDAQEPPTSHKGFAARSKRSTPSWNTCRLVAVADYRFYQTMGGRDIYTTASYMAGVIERVDALYKRTVWNSAGLTGLGFEIALMQIHVSPTTVVGDAVHYNMAGSSWDTLQLLRVFGRDLDFKDYCLAHLFTHQSFANNVLGLAYIASPKTGSVGGICSGVRSIDGVPTSLNTALSSTKNQKGNVVLAQMADLVTAHELGHNWGSEHDGSECSPSSIIGDGKYLMYQYSVSGVDPNNYQFSPCSKVLINSVLQSKGIACFKERTTQLSCGNGLVESELGEQCDAGYLGRFGLDPCCSSTCQFLGSAVCSPVNHECCVNCQMASLGHVCVADTNVTCLDASYCAGNSFDCPAAEKKPDDTPCLDEGMCRDGQCLPFCEGRGLISCICDGVDTSCYRCCRVNASSLCERFDPASLLPDGRPCVQGYCTQGTCKRTVQNTIERLFSIIENLSINEIIIFFRDNLIGAVLISSLLVWVPVCIGIRIRDYRHKKRFVDDMYREIKKDRVLLYDQDGRKKTRPILKDGKSDLRELKDSNRRF
ncbi:ADAM 17-like protease [Haliotis rufescens]|uniref:ADAM 17-like protease n=1 Tax=Haliotis rufescens TaxID=6454 RepID=UPI00201EF52A|nr:ADAM 17-like protease [Haliotis rufescens]